MNPTAQNIVDSANRMIRDGGYHSFSFRQIADELGIKSASIHYHFPTKEDLGFVVTKQYTDNFIRLIGDPEELKKPLDFYTKAFENSLKENKRACLCGILAAESGRLPQSIRKILEDFSDQNIAWLENALKHQLPNWTNAKARGVASVVFATLEGAMIFAAMTEKSDHIRHVSKSLKALLV